MEGGDQLHVPAAATQVHNGREAGCALELVWTLWKRWNLVLSEIRTPVVQPEAHNCTDVPTLAAVKKQAEYETDTLAARTARTNICAL